MNKRDAQQMLTKIDGARLIVQSTLDALYTDIESGRVLARVEASEEIAEKLVGAKDALDETMTLICETFDLDPLAEDG